MKKLNNIPTNNLINWFNNIVQNKDPGNVKNELILITNTISSRYNEYLNNFDFQNLINIADSQFVRNHGGLVSCYKSEGNTLKLLKKEITDQQENDLKGLCQYCGVLKPKTFDHYVPISLYPEFSALAINLIPCCKDCNGKKHNYWKENGYRGIINFYVDNIPSSQFLFGNVIFTSGIPHAEYELRNPNSNIDVFFFDIVLKHYSRLELYELYKDMSTNELGEIIRTFKIYIENPTIESLRQNLIIDAQQLQTQFGINYWRAILRITLSESDQFLNYLIDIINE